MRLSAPLVFLFLAPAAAAEIELIPITLNEARASFKDEIFEKNSEEAAKAGVKLDETGGGYVARGYANGRAFILFFNHARARDCGRDYLLQRVCLTKISDKGGGEVVTEKSYLVEAMKLDREKRTKKPDEHRKGYSLGEARRRTLVAEYEIGCGELPGAAEGDAWPFEPGVLYKRIQNYTGDGTVYAQVRFDHSRVYRFEMEFDDDGRHSIIPPDFMPWEKQ